MKVTVLEDVSGLPTELGGSRNVTWWGAMGGEVIEGAVLLLTIFAWFYLRNASDHWPPLHTPLPRLGVPTASLIVLVLSVIPAWWAHRMAERQDRIATAIGLGLHALLAAGFLALRFMEFRALGVRWDTNAYGSVSWAFLFTHGYMGFFDLLDTLGLLLLFLRLQPEEKHFIDVTENSFFWYFVVATWIPCYLLVYFGPRWL
jgi:heme/copper-type cytochrome/quinol oxidase subunit 3